MATAKTDLVSSNAGETSTGPTPSTLEHHIGNSLALASGLETMLQNDEIWAKQNGRKVQLYSPSFRKEKERLEEFKNGKAVNRSLEDVRTLLGTIRGLESALSKTLKDIEVRGKPGVQAGSSHHTDIKFSSKDTDVKIAQVMNIFRNSNNMASLRQFALQRFCGAAGSDIPSLLQEPNVDSNKWTLEC
jgi:hypothetical protein